MENKKKNNNLILVLIIASVFGLSSGLVGEIIARAYLFNNSFNVPFFAEIDFDNNNGGSSVVIRNPRKVVVEQNEKVTEVAASVSKSIVGIYEKIKERKEINSDNNTDILNPKEEYRLQDRIGEAFVVTSDGWIISNFVPSDKNIAKATTSIDLISESFADYVIITKDKKIHKIERVVFSPNLEYSFWKIESKDLPVVEMVSTTDVKSGQMLVGIDFDGRVETVIINDLNKNDNLVKYSDNFKKSINLSNGTKKGFFYFNLKGGAVGFPDEEGKLYLVDNYTYAIDSLLNNEKIDTINYGIYYLDLSEFVSQDDEVSEKGAQIYPNSAGISIEKNSLAEKAGFKIGDIILTVNNIEIGKNNDLAYVLSTLKLNEKLYIEYLRNNEIERIEIDIR